VRWAIFEVEGEAIWRGGNQSNRGKNKRNARDAADATAGCRAERTSCSYTIPRMMLLVILPTMMNKKNERAGRGGEEGSSVLYTGGKTNLDKLRHSKLLRVVLLVYIMDFLRVKPTLVICR